MRTDEQRRRAVAYLNSHPEQREKQRVRARELARTKRAGDAGFRHRAEFYQALLELQGSEVCAICSESPSAGKRLQVDHDHDTDEIRGLLCARCNRMLGQAGDTEKLLLRAIDYLRGPYLERRYAEYTAVPIRIRYGKKDVA